VVQFLKYYYVTKYTLSIILRTVDYIYTMQSAGFVSSKLIMKFFYFSWPIRVHDIMKINQLVTWASHT